MSAAAQRGFADVIVPHVLDLVEDDLPDGEADAFWIRWVLAFVSDPALVVSKLARALKPGGAAVIHEYLNYESFTVVPDDGSIRGFTDQVVKDWRASGGEPDIGRDLPALLLDQGMRIVSMTPIVDVVQPSSFIWQWPASWLRNYPTHLVEAGKLTPEWARRVPEALAKAEADPKAIMITPTVMEIIAVKL